jgi:hypothetical protein
MEFTDERDIGIERDETDYETDYVSAWILALAVGMIVLGTVFAMLDRYQFFDHFPEPPQSHSAA